MIDRYRRDKLALHLRQYTSGRIWNQTFEDKLANDISNGWLPEQYQISSDSDPDPLIPPMLEHVWFLYSDCSFHKARGKHAIIGEDRKEVAKYILFLHSDREYAWPSFRFVNLEIDSEGLFTRLIRKFFPEWVIPLTSGKFEVTDVDEFMQFGDYNFWPFINKEEYECELSNVRYLSGKTAAKNL
jgi:hypothetical protein